MSHAKRERRPGPMHPVTGQQSVTMSLFLCFSTRFPPVNGRICSPPNVISSAATKQWNHALVPLRLLGVRPATKEISQPLQILQQINLSVPTQLTQTGRTQVKRPAQAGRPPHVARHVHA